MAVFNPKLYLNFLTKLEADWYIECLGDVERHGGTNGCRYVALSCAIRTAGLGCTLPSELRRRYPGLASVAGPKAATDMDPTSTSEAESESEAETEPESETEAETEPEPESESESEPDPSPEPVSESPAALEPAPEAPAADGTRAMECVHGVGCKRCEHWGGSYDQVLDSFLQEAGMGAAVYMPGLEDDTCFYPQDLNALEALRAQGRVLFFTEFVASAHIEATPQDVIGGFWGYLVEQHRAQGWSGASC